jgi:hypothetical protein
LALGRPGEAPVTNRSPRRLSVMDRRHKQKREPNLKRYHPLLELATDEPALVAPKRLAIEIMGHLNHINDSQLRALYYISICIHTWNRTNTLYRKPFFPQAEMDTRNLITNHSQTGRDKMC